jgi:hypothetical protein
VYENTYSLRFHITNLVEMRRKGRHFGVNLFVAGFYILTMVVMKRSIFWDIMPYSPLKAKLKVTCSSRTSFDFQQAVQHYIIFVIFLTLE